MFIVAIKWSILASSDECIKPLKKVEIYSIQSINMHQRRMISWSSNDSAQCRLICIAPSKFVSPVSTKVSTSTSPNILGCQRKWLNWGSCNPHHNGKDLSWDTWGKQWIINAPLIPIIFSCIHTKAITLKSYKVHLLLSRFGHFISMRVPYQQLWALERNTFSSESTPCVILMHHLYRIRDSHILHNKTFLNLLNESQGREKHSCHRITTVFHCRTHIIH